MASSADRNLLFGVLAWQNGVITQDQLLEGMKNWSFEKSKSLGQILEENNALTNDKRGALEPMVDAHLQFHDGDAALALQSLAPDQTLTSKANGQISDTDVQASLVRLGTLAPQVVPPSDPHATLETPSADTQQRFQILRPHAKGGLGEVFVAHDSELNRQVALKEIQSSYSEQRDSRSRFLREAEITGSLEHPRHRSGLRNGPIR